MLCVRNHSLLFSLLVGIALHSHSGQKAIIIGASSGIGRETAKALSKEGYTLGLVARRTELLQNLQHELPNPSSYATIDVSGPDARERLEEFVQQMGGVDLLVISMSAHADNLSKNATELSAAQQWERKQRYIDVDMKAFMAMADVALDFFKKQGFGHLVGISSMDGLRGMASRPEYSAAKAGISRYMEACRNFLIQNGYKNIFITDICPGYVAVEHTPLGSNPTAYWEITAQEAAETIVQGILNKEKFVYVPRKAWLPGFLLGHLPDRLYNTYLAWL